MSHLQHYHLLSQLRLLYHFSFCYFGMCFDLVICYPMANFGPLLRGQSHSPEVNHCNFSMFNSKVTGKNERFFESDLYSLMSCGLYIGLFLVFFLENILHSLGVLVLNKNPFCKSRLHLPTYNMWGSKTDNTDEATSDCTTEFTILLLYCCTIVQLYYCLGLYLCTL